MDHSIVSLAIAVSSTAPIPVAFAKGALIAPPLAAVRGGITEFLVLDGVDQFPLLAISMALTVSLGAHLIMSRRTKLIASLRCRSPFFPVLLGPTYPESCNPETYVDDPFLAVLAVVIPAMLLATLLPTSDERRRGWISRPIRWDARAFAAGRSPRFSP